MALTNDDLQAIAALIRPINNRLDSMDNRLDSMDNRLDKIESEVSSVKASQLELKKEVREIKHKVNDTYELALDAWGTSSENRKLIENAKLQA